MDKLWERLIVDKPPNARFSITYVRGNFNPPSMRRGIRSVSGYIVVAMFEPSVETKTTDICIISPEGVWKTGIFIPGRDENILENCVRNLGLIKINMWEKFDSEKIDRCKYHHYGYSSSENCIIKKTKRLFT